MKNQTISKDKVEEFISKYFKINFNSDRSFVYTFLHNAVFKDYSPYLNNIFSIMKSFCKEYYEYNFITKKFVKCNELILDEYKVIISSNFKYLLFYDKRREEITVVGSKLVRVLSRFKQDKIKFVYRLKEEANKYYISQIKKPSKYFLNFIYCFIDEPMAASRNEYKHEEMQKLSQEEAKIALEMAFDLGDIHSSFYCYTIESLYNEQVYNYLMLIDSCPSLDESSKAENLDKIFYLSKDVSLLPRIIKIYQKNKFGDGYPFHTFANRYKFLNREDFNLLTKLRLLSPNNDIRSDGYRDYQFLHREYKFHKKFKVDVIKKHFWRFYEIIRDMNIENYEDFIEKLFLIDEVDDQVDYLISLIDEYSNNANIKVKG